MTNGLIQNDSSYTMDQDTLIKSTDALNNNR